jgi:serine/threonine-protein kinase
MSKQRKRIGPYRLLAELGTGGMGSVWHAVHEVLQREVAIKELLAKAAKDREAIERFRREGMALAQLKHESIVGIHDLLISADKLYMVLEYVDGLVLVDLIKAGPLPWDVVAILGASLASALEHAHFHKVIHRDVKPGNIMLSKAGEVKLMDFGIARDQLLGDLTRTGLAVGTPSYMAPEILRGEKADALSDLYSLGVTLYECASGKRPFARADSQKTFAAIVSGKYEPLHRVAPALPRRFCRIVERCLRRDPRRRFQAAADLREAFERLLAERGAKSNHRARVVGFLASQKHISETEALTCIDAAELLETAAANYGLARRRSWRVALALAVVGAAGVLGWWAGQQPWLPRGLPTSLLP